MARILSLSIVAAVLMVITIHQTVALKCWNFHSEDVLPGGVIQGNKECGDPFDGKKLGESYLTDGFDTENPACVKVKWGNRVIREWISGESMKEFEEFCKNPHLPSGSEKLDYCGFCKTDGCNGANQFVPLVLLIGFPVAIAFIFKNLQA